MIKSISYDQSEILNSIIQLYVPSKIIECDPTYSKGNFYKGTSIAEPIYKFDIFPQFDDVIRSDCRHLPFPDSSLSSIIFDPPFLATTGKSLSLDDSSNKINKRFGVYPNEKALHQFYVDSLKEFYRILKEDGILIFKCQDKVSSGNQYMSHCFIMEQAVRLGYYPKDLFILLAKNRLVADWQLKNQKSARKFHCYFWVFQKSKKSIRYI